jgi:hypothetical protein
MVLLRFVKFALLCFVSFCVDRGDVAFVHTCGLVVCCCCGSITTLETFCSPSASKPKPSYFTTNTYTYYFSLKDSNCLRQFSSYRATFELKQGQWTTVRLPWSRFEGFGWGAVENLLDSSALRRIGLVAIGKEMDVSFALSSIRFLQD